MSPLSIAIVTGQ